MITRYSGGATNVGQACNTVDCTAYGYQYTVPTGTTLSDPANTGVSLNATRACKCVALKPDLMRTSSSTYNFNHKSEDSQSSAQAVVLQQRNSWQSSEGRQLSKVPSRSDQSPRKTNSRPTFGTSVRTETSLSLPKHESFVEGLACDVNLEVIDSCCCDSDSCLSFRKGLASHIYGLVSSGFTWALGLAARLCKSRNPFKDKPTVARISCIVCKWSVSRSRY